MKEPEQKFYPCDEYSVSADLPSANSEQIVEQIILALCNSVEAKDKYTNGHSQRVALYSRRIAQKMGWDDRQCRRVYFTGLLHDVGKIRISDTIITKSEGLRDDEYEEMKLHTLAGYYILKNVSAISDFALGARWHHERYDGKGYPNRLSGENIPLIARIIGVADAYDAMTSVRSYRMPLPQEQVKEEIRKGMGKQFDPDIAAIMIEMIEEDTDYKMRQPTNVTERYILAIDDNPMELMLINHHVKSMPGFHIITALNAKDGLDMLYASHIDLVLLDVEMPGHDGFYVLEKIREQDKDLPVIFMTGERDMEIIQRAENMGINDYLTKPVKFNVLFESIQNVLKPKTYFKEDLQP